MATTVPAIPQSAIGNASQEPVTMRRNAIVASVSVTATISTARTAESRTGSGSLRRGDSSSTHSDRPALPAPPSSYFRMVRSLPPRGPSYRSGSG
ncbi:hypothetical protein GCM10020254_68940 [Streptomyces goshikiensis]